MDNLTHSITGLALGELVERSLPEETDPANARVRHGMLLLCGAMASNFPDLDLVLTPLLPPPLGYLLNHRGHTHTLLAALPQALAMLALIWLLWPGARRLLRQSTAARTGAAVATAAGLLLHMTMDYLNSYGVHPFAPFDARWLYGDMIFIIEPMFWVTLGVPLAMMVPRASVRRLLLFVLAAALLLFTVNGFMHWASLVLMAPLGSALAWLQQRTPQRGRSALLTGIAAALGFVAVQGVASAHARSVLAAQLHERDPAARMLDAALTPLPANPLCWTFVSVESDAAADRFRLRRGMLTLAPGLMPLAACPSRFAGAFADAPAASTVALTESDEGSLQALRHLQRTDCHVDAWLRFARAPAFDEDKLTDVRFGLAGTINFSTLPYKAMAATPCPGRVPQWAYPRADLLWPDAPVR